MSTEDNQLFALPKPKCITESEVVLTRADWDRLAEALRAFEADEDAADIAELARVRQDDASFAVRLESERGTPIEITIPIEIVQAKLDGVHPLKAWREYRVQTQMRLSLEAGVSRDLIAKIETRRKNGSVQTLDRLARALLIPIEALLEDKEEQPR